MRREQRAAEVLASPRGRYFCDAATAGASYVEPDERLALWRGVDLLAIRGLTEPAELLEPMTLTMDSASYWGEHHGDAEVRTESERRALTEVIEAVLASRAMDWWSMPFDPSSQFLLANDRSWHGFDAPPTRGARARLSEWRERAQEDNRRGVPKKAAVAEGGGEWWSVPLWHSIRSTRPLADLPALEMEVEEDGFGARKSRVFHLLPTSDVRVREIDGPDDWFTLVESYPFEVTGAMRGNWWLTTRIDDAWFIPDWASVSADFDVVHLTGMGYLTTAGRPLPVAGGHTLMAGFSPDQSFWLTDSFELDGPGIDWDPDRPRPLG